MKKLFLSIALLITSFAGFSQAPELINYQAVARNASGDLIANGSLGVRISVRGDNPTGNILYSETHTVTTNLFGVFTLMIGSGNVVSGNMNQIVAGNSERFLETEIDVNGGTNYTSLGTTQLISVPFALRAKNADGIDGNPVVTTSPSTGEILKFNGTSWENVPADFTSYPTVLETSKDLIVKEINSTQTGNANLIPLAYGKVNGINGTLYTGTSTSNLSVVKTSTGVYTITIAGEMYGFTSNMTITNIEDESIPGIAVPSAIANTLTIKTYNMAGTLTDQTFSFVVYKK